MSGLNACRKRAPALHQKEDPQVVRGFDPKHNKTSVRVLPGACYVTGAKDEMIITILGSCVAACVRNPHIGFGGLNHFMLPERAHSDGDNASAAMRYGSFAMEVLINKVLKSGCAREDLEIKLFGGANVTSGSTLIGEKNAEFALRYLEREGLRLSARDLGGTRGRRIHYCPHSGTVKRRMQKSAMLSEVIREEQTYCSLLQTRRLGNDAELFKERC